MRRGAGLGLGQAFDFCFVKSGESVPGRQQCLHERIKVPRPVAGSLPDKEHSVSKAAILAPARPKYNSRAALGNKKEEFGRSKLRGREFQQDPARRRTRQLAKAEELRLLPLSTDPTLRLYYGKDENGAYDARHRAPKSPRIRCCCKIS